MKILLTVLFLLCTVLLIGCLSPTEKSQQPIIISEKPKITPSSDSVTPQNPEIKIEPHLYIIDAKAIVYSSSSVGIEFNTNVPAISRVRLIANEIQVSTQAIYDKKVEHSYRFSGLKQLTQYYAIIEAESDTNDRTVITFDTLADYIIEPTYQSYPYFFYGSYYPYTPYIPPSTPTVFWNGTTTVIINSP